VSLSVGFPVEAERLFAVRPVGNDGLDATLFQPLPQFGTIVGLVTEKLDGRLGATDQTVGRRTIVRFAAAQEDGKKTAFSICDCMDLRIAPAS
jgi:hypothetical protein